MRERLNPSTESREWTMYNELLSQLENKIQDAVETIEMYRMEIAELKEKNSEFENQHQVWEEKLSSLISKFESVSEQEDTDTKNESYESLNSEAADSESSSMESAAEDDTGDDSETSSAYSSTTAIGSQAVASSTHYSNYDE